jgi:hypothetical protein
LQRPNQRKLGGTGTELEQISTRAMFNLLGKRTNTNTEATTRIYVNVDACNHNAGQK